MRLKISSFIVFCALFIVSGAAQAESGVFKIQVDGFITPAMADYVIDGIHKADRESASAILIEINSAGGLLEPAKKAVAAVHNAPLPVIVYVPASGQARSVSFLFLLAADIAATAPNARIGGTGQAPLIDLSKKTFFDKTSFLQNAIYSARELATRNGRNISLVEQLIKEGREIAGSDAYVQNLVENVAPSTPELLAQLDGRMVSKNRRTYMMSTTPPTGNMHFSDLRGLRHSLYMPKTILLLLTLGMCGVLLTLTSRTWATLANAALLGCLARGLFSLYYLPVNIAGAGFLAAALALLITELARPFRGLFAGLGLILFAVGTNAVIDPFPLLNIPPISMGLAVPAAFLLGIFMFVVIMPRATTQGRGRKNKADQLVGELGKVKERLSPRGIILVKGELWPARATSIVEVGEDVYIDRVDGNYLLVRRIFVP